MGPASPISLADVVALPVTHDWTEVIAVVEELCAVLLAEAPDAALIPDPQDILITAYGSVMIRKGARGTADVEELGRLLHGQLDPVLTPARVRLFASDAIGSGKYPTVRAYAEALGYYGRPNRAELIRTLYTRCLTTPAEDLPPPPLPVPEPPPVLGRRGWRIALVVLLATLCGVAASAVVWAWGREAFGKASPVREVLSAALESVGLRTNPPEAGDGPAADTRMAGGRPPRSDNAGRGASLEPRGGASGTPESAGDDRAVFPVIEGDLAFPPAVPTTMPALPPSMLDDQAIYSETADGVQPPVLLSPKLPPVGVVERRSGGANTIELLIDQLGHVEHVRFVSEYKRLPDMHMLSAAKVWLFHPALKDGKPVRYRLEISWIVSPP